MFKEPELKPGQKLTPMEHPRQAFAPLAEKLRWLMMLVVVLAAAGVLLLLKQQGEYKRSIGNEKNAALQQAIPAAMKGESSHKAHTALLERVGQTLAYKSDAKAAPMKWHFHLLAEENAINLYALSSGDVYVTTALINRMKTEGMLAAALAHGMAHAMKFDQPELLPNATEAAPQWSYALESEAPADILGLSLMAQAGYDPSATIALFSVLSDGYAKGADVAYFSTHPNDRDRLNKIQAAITRMYPQGVPAVLSK